MNLKRLKQLRDVHVKDVKLGNLRLGDFDINELKLKCRIGLHDWTEWAYLTEDNCLQERRCLHPNCDMQETRHLHLWTEWDHASEDSCDQTRSCVRCQENEVQQEHSWELIYESPHSCKQVMACKRCQTPKPGILATLASQQQKHEWSKWEFEADTSCVQYRTCARCGERSNKDMPHQWGEWMRTVPNECRLVRTCHRCLTRDQERIEHHYGEWKRVDSQCLHERRCMVCGSADQELMHEWQAVRRGINTDELALKQFLNLMIQNGATREEVDTIKHRFISQSEDLSLNGYDERGRSDMNRLIGTLANLAEKYEVSESFMDLRIEIQIISDSNGTPYLYNKRKQMYTQAYCGQCSTWQAPSDGG